VTDTPVLLYDGGCGFCNATVRFVLRHDRVGTLRFAPLGGAFGARVLAAHPELASLDSAIWYEPGSARVLTRSAAALRVARYLGGAWQVAEVFWIVPRPLRDLGYDFVAWIRHRVTLGDADWLPSLEMRERFLA
jgi:predicted DCC family thiol-disulfide oxidoreductase YuxK